jgi:hypothetical protein
MKKNYIFLRQKMFYNFFLLFILILSRTLLVLFTLKKHKKNVRNKVRVREGKKKRVKNKEKF